VCVLFTNGQNCGGFLVVFEFVVLGFEFRALCLLGRHSVLLIWITVNSYTVNCQGLELLKQCVFS
jgi:hypothetical protein